MTIRIATIINWTNGIALLGFLPLLIDIVVKFRLYKKEENFEFKEIFDFEFFKSLAIGVLIFVFALFENNAKENEKANLSNKVGGLKIEVETIHSKDSAQSVLDRESDKKEILTGIGNAIGKYSLGYDSAKQELTKLSKLIKDSANRKTIVVEGETPVVEFAPSVGLSLIFKRNDSIKYSVNFVSKNAGSTVNYVKFYTLVSFNGLGGIFKDLKFVSKQFIITRNTNFAKDEGNGRSANIVTDSNFINKIKSLIVYLSGSYTDSRGNNKQEISEVAVLNLVSNELIILATPYDDDVIYFLKDHNFL